MSKSFEELLEVAKTFEMTAEQQEEQRQSFAFGNANIENDHVTRETVAEAARSLRRAAK